MTKAGRYQLLDRIATGGMAELFRARVIGAEGFSKVLAIKRILPHLAGDETFVKMLIAEARLAANLEHPNIAQVIELGHDDQGYFIVMEFVNGPNLGAVLRRLSEQGRRLPEAIALDVAIQLLQGLEYAHRLSDNEGRPLHMVHQDVSPENVLISSTGMVKLADFGVAKVKSYHQTRTRGIRGKLPYMSPEQIAGREIDGRSDIFAAALVLWECLAGQLHYDAENEGELIRQVSEGKARRLASLGIKVAPEIDAALCRALERDVESRYQSASELANDLSLFHRRAYPSHSPQALGDLVRELFKAQFDLLADRLRRFERGEEAPVGMAGGSEAAIVSTIRPEPVVPHLRRPELKRRPTAETRVADTDLSERPGDDDAEEATTLAPRRSRVVTAPTPRTVDMSNLPATLLAVTVAILLLGGAGLVAYQWLSRASLEPVGEVTTVEPVQEPARPEAKEPKEPAKRPERRETARAVPAAARGERADSSSGGGQKRVGLLDLDCRPDCEIEIDGRRVGRSPLRGLTLEAGTHRVRAVNRFVNLTKTRIIEIEADKTTRRTINLVTDP